MIYIVHGEDTSKSRALILNHQKKLAATSKIILDIKSTNPNELYEKCVSSSLFGEAPLVVLDVTDSGRTGVDDFVSILKKIPETSTLIIFSAKTLTKTNPFISVAGKLDAKVIENSVFTDANIFKFTDVLYSKNRTQTYTELNKLTHEQYDPFYIFSMILYGLRSMAKVLWGAPSSIKMKPFQTAKLEGMLKQFPENKIKSLFAYFYDLEKKAKSGGVAPEIAVTLAVEKVLNF